MHVAAVHRRAPRPMDRTRTGPDAHRGDKSPAHGKGPAGGDHPRRGPGCASAPSSSAPGGGGVRIPRMIPGNPAVPAARLPMNFPGDRGFEGAHRPDGSRTGPIGAVRFITLAGGGPAGEDHLSSLWISGAPARVSPLWLSADLPPLGDRVLVRVHPGRDRDRRADAPSGPPMTPSTAADGSDQDRAGDVLAQRTWPRQGRHCPAGAWGKPPGGGDPQGVQGV